MYRILKKVYNLAFKETHLINFNKVFIIQLSQMNGKWEKQPTVGEWLQRIPLGIG